VLRLKIENFDRLPDGGPLDYVANQRGFDFGRDNHLDWALPDKTRVISGKHCEIRFYEDAYWLVDVSTNGTFVNGNSTRVKSPYRLNEGDTLRVGEYVISVTIDLPPAQNQVSLAASIYQEPVRKAGIWDAGGNVPPPIDARELAPRPVPGEIAPDVLHQAMFVPAARVNEEPLTPRVPSNAWSADPAPREEQPVRPAPIIATPAPVAPAPLAPAPVVQGDGAASADFLRRFAKGAQLPEDVVEKMDAGQLAEQAGELLHLASAHLMAMLQARAEAKALSKTGSRTLIRATENNPLKFMPTPEEALQAMLMPRGKGYLDARATLDSSFGDLKTHHLALLAAMQAAASELLDEVSPFTVEKNQKSKKSLLSGGKSKQWDDLMKVWADKSGRRENGMLDAFLDLFAEHYDKFSRMKSS